MLMNILLGGELMIARLFIMRQFIFGLVMFRYDYFDIPIIDLIFLDIQMMGLEALLWLNVWVVRGILGTNCFETFTIFIIGLLIIS
jgi:hypothetical protein